MHGIELSGETWARQAKKEVVKIQNIFFPTGLEVHLEDNSKLKKKKISKKIWNIFFIIGFVITN